MLSRQFLILILLGRPAAGKSEIINYLKSLPCDTRRAELHIGAFREIDDFPMLWAWFEEDRMLAQMGKPRLHTDEQGYFRFRYLWNLLIRRLELEYQKVLRDDPGFEKDNTVIIEFSRGAEHGGFGEALNQFSADLLGRAAVLYVDVSYEESLRKNRKRSNPEKPDSILEHSLPDDKLERLYKKSDWTEITAADPSHLQIGDVRVPYAVFDNSDDITTPGGEALGERLRAAVSGLWQSYANP